VLSARGTMHRRSDGGFAPPPIAAVALDPLQLLPRPAAIALVAALSVAGTAALLWLWFRRPLPVVAGIAVLAAAEPWLDALSLGRIDVVLVALVGLDLLVLRRGPLVGLAAALGLTPALFIAYLVIARRYREAAVAGGVAAAATGLGWLVAPAESGRYWGGLLERVTSVGGAGDPADQSLAGALQRLQAPDAVWPLLALAVVLFWTTRLQPSGDWAGFALTGVAMCLVSPVTWVYSLVWELPAVLTLLDRRRWLAAAVLAVMALGLVWLVPVLSVLTLIGLVLLAAVPRERTSDVSA
jgi:alpha-1,2-mannosyltransferase